MDIPTQKSIVGPKRILNPTTLRVGGLSLKMISGVKSGWLSTLGRSVILFNP